MRKLFVLLLVVSGGLLWAQTNAPVPKPKLPPTEINSDSADFDMKTRRMTYRNHVEVIDPKIKLTCEWLVVDLPLNGGGRLSHISAETNVVIDFFDEKGTTYHVSSDKAVYAYSVANAVTNETVTFTGNPLVDTAEGKISCDPLIWDRAKGRFTFGGGYKMILNQHLNEIGGSNAAPTKLF